MNYEDFEPGKWTRVRVKISRLRLESEFQRVLDKPRATREIVKKWCELSANEPKCGIYPNGTIGIADGQHTTWSREQCGEEWVWVWVTTVQDDAAFKRLVDICNPPGRKMGAIDNFWRALANNEPEPSMIRDVASRNGYALVRCGSNNNTLDSIRALLRIARDAGESGLGRVLSFTREAFDGKSVDEYVLLGSHIFLTHCGVDPAFQRAALLNILRNEPRAGMKRQVETTAKASGVTRAQAYALLFRDLYNENTGKGSRKIKADIP